MILYLLDVVHTLHIKVTLKSMKKKQKVREGLVHTLIKKKKKKKKKWYLDTHINVQQPLHDHMKLTFPFPFFFFLMFFFFILGLRTVRLG
jgi:hypothetical protein